MHGLLRGKQRADAAGDHPVSTVEHLAAEGSDIPLRSWWRPKPELKNSEYLTSICESATRGEAQSWLMELSCSRLNSWSIWPQIASFLTNGYIEKYYSWSYSFWVKLFWRVHESDGFNGGVKGGALRYTKPCWHEGNPAAGRGLDARRLIKELQGFSSNHSTQRRHHLTLLWSNTEVLGLDGIKVSFHLIYTLPPINWTIWSAEHQITAGKIFFKICSLNVLIKKEHHTAVGVLLIF